MVAAQVEPQRLGALPPTPPSHSNEASPLREKPSEQHDLFGLTSEGDRFLNPRMPKGLRTMTPINQRSPPTPDRTPPVHHTSSLSRQRQSIVESSQPIPQPPNFDSSSRAQSFVTAKEDVSSNDGSENRGGPEITPQPLDILGWTTPRNTSYRRSLRRDSGINTHRRVSSESYAQAKKLAETQAAERIATQPEPQANRGPTVEQFAEGLKKLEEPFEIERRTRSLLRSSGASERYGVIPRVLDDPFVAGAGGSAGESPRRKVEEVPNREWDTNLMRNVTTRRKRLPKSTQQGENIAPQPQMQEKTVQDFIVPPKLREYHNQDRPSTGSSVSYGRRNLSGGLWKDEERMATPDVDNFIVDSKRNSTISTTSTIMAAFVIPDQEQPLRKRTIRHVKRHSELRSVSDPQRTFTHRPSPSLPNVHRLNRIKYDSVQQYSSRPSTSNDHEQRLHEEPPSQHAPQPPPKSFIGRELEARIQTPVEAPARVRSKQSRATPPVEPRVKPRELQERNTNYQMHQVYYPTVAQMKFAPLPQPEVKTSPSPLSIDMPQRRLTHKRASISSKASNVDEPVIDVEVPRPTSDVHLDLRTPPIDDEVPEPQSGHENFPPRASADHLSLPGEDPRRISLDRATFRSDYSTARHLHTQTPFSEISGTHEPMEVVEATAMRIMPHNNESVLVIEQPSRRLTLDQTDIPPVPPLPKDVKYMQHQQDQGNPDVTIQPSTPEQQVIEDPVGVDSPMKNPRKAPMPPVFKVIPPTPNDEEDKQLAPPEDIQDTPRRPSPPVRRQSLIKKARRYSDSLLQPFLPRKTVRRRTQSPHIGAVRDARNEMLHPEWRPRYTEDDYDDYFGDYYEPEDADDRLPPGGDTSDVESIEGERRVRKKKSKTFKVRGLGKIKARFEEKRKEKKREEIRRKIGTRFMVEGGPMA